MGFMSWLLGNDNKKNIKKLSLMAESIDALSPKYEAMTDSELQSQTEKFKQQLASGKTLDDILFEAFATVREASKRVLNMKHFKVQLMGGISLHQGRIAEMRTGEGKTLVATLPAYLNALSGKGVHIVTVNEYLARRDAEWMGKIYNFLGVSVSVIYSKMDRNEKKQAYKADITYGTNNEFGFDYLRDNMVINLEDKMQRDLDYAIIDEVDSILIDEARTPLIISGPSTKSSNLYASVAKFVRGLRKDSDYEYDEEKKSINLTEDGSYKAERFFNIENLGDADNTELNHHLQQALRAQFVMSRDNEYVVKDGEIIIVDEHTGRLMEGRRFSGGLHQAIEAKENVKINNENKTLATITFQNYFRSYRRLSGMTGTAKTEEEEFNGIYGLDVVVIPTNLEMIRIDNNDMVYTTVEAKLRNVIERIEEEHKTGRPVLVGTVTVEKSEQLSELLKRKGIKHTVLNAKNHEMEAEIVAQAGRKNAVTIATNMAGRGTDILLGGNPEYMAKTKLRNKGLEHEVIEKITNSYAVLNDEEQVLRDEYLRTYEGFKLVTEKEKQEVIGAGGLMIIGTERHESRRIDNQLRGRAGRQGDSGESVFYVSLNDELCRLFVREGIRSMVARINKDENVALSMGILSKAIENAQKKIEGKNYSTRKHVLEYDNVMNMQREVIYKERNKILRGENIHSNVVDMIEDVVNGIIFDNVGRDNDLASCDVESFNKSLEGKVLPPDANFVTADMIEKLDVNTFRTKLVKEVVNQYETKIERYKEMGLDFNDVERVVLLKNFDNEWVEHIDSMQELKNGVSLRAYGQVDPVSAFKKEGREMFLDMLDEVKKQTANILLRVELKSVPTINSVDNNSTTNAEQMGPRVHSKSAIGRNEQCPCGSGKKYKNCCGNK